MSLANATLTASAASIFTSAGTDGSAITSITFHNTDVAARTVTLHACPAAEAAADENKLIVVSIPAGETFAPDLGKLILANTDDLKALADVTSVVVTTVSYLDL